MAKKKRPTAKGAQYESNTIAAFAMIGIVLIVIGLVSLLTVVCDLKSAFFVMVRRCMQGLGGGLCIGISILVLWLGVLMVFSAGKHMPKRGYFLVSLLFLSILGIVDLLSKVGTYSLMEYLTLQAGEGFFQMLKGCYGVCSASGAFGGAVGILLAWPVWHFFGTTFGTVALGVVCLLCLLFVSRFDLMQMVDTVRTGVKGRNEQKQKQHEQDVLNHQLEQQRLQEEQARQYYAQQMQMQQPVQQTQQITMTNFEQVPQQVMQPQTELYDEVIVPREKKPFWARGAQETSEETKTQPEAASTPIFSFRNPLQLLHKETPEEPQPDPVQEEAAAAYSRRKAMERIEVIRQRKAAQQSQSTPSYAPPVYEQSVQTPEPVPSTFAPAVPEPSARETSSEIPQPEPFTAEKIFAPVEDKEDFYPPVEEETPEETAPHQITFAPAVAAKAQNASTQKETPKPEEKPEVENTVIPYAYPSIDLLDDPQKFVKIDNHETDAADAARLEQTLESFGIPAKVQYITHGPAVTRYELGLTSSGINVKRILSIADNIALDMAANGGVRIEVPIPGKNLFGVEIPNRTVQSVSFAEVLMSPEIRNAKSPLAVALGRDITGKAVVCDLEKMPHLLIAGQTGSGKSVCINSIINSLLFRTSPEEVRMIMVDPKVVELQCYNGVPHLLIPVVSDPKKASGALQWAVAEMMDRYHKLESKNVRNIEGYNAKLEPGEPKLPRIVIIIDELADLMLACKKEVEESIQRIAQLARAAGIHMVVATQRPTVDVITGLIKANIPSRIAFAVASSIDSRTILDQNGAEKLLGRGDMFYAPTGVNAPIRVQGCFLSDRETERVVKYIQLHSNVSYDSSVIDALEKSEEEAAPIMDQDNDAGMDDRLQEAIEMVLTDGQASISMLQRRMKIGYARAGRLIDDMAAMGIVSKSAGSKPREVLMTREEYERQKNL